MSTLAPGRPFGRGRAAQRWLPDTEGLRSKTKGKRRSLSWLASLALTGGTLFHVCGHIALFISRGPSSRLKGQDLRFKMQMDIACGVVELLDRVIWWRRSLRALPRPLRVFVLPQICSPQPCSRPAVIPWAPVGVLIPDSGPVELSFGGWSPGTSLCRSGWGGAGGAHASGGDGCGCCRWGPWLAWWVDWFSYG